LEQVKSEIQKWPDYLEAIPAAEFALKDFPGNSDWSSCCTTRQDPHAEKESESYATSEVMEVRPLIGTAGEPGGGALTRAADTGSGGAGCGYSTLQLQGRAEHEQL